MTHPCRVLLPMNHTTVNPLCFSTLQGLRQIKRKSLMLVFTQVELYVRHPYGQRLESLDHPRQSPPPSTPSILSAPFLLMQCRVDVLRNSCSGIFLILFYATHNNCSPLYYLPYIQVFLYQACRGPTTSIILNVTHLSHSLLGSSFHT